MLSQLRKHSKSALTYVIFGIIIVVFVFTFNYASPEGGCGSGGAANQIVYAKVEKAEITKSDLLMGLALTLDPPPLIKKDIKDFQYEMYYKMVRFARLKGNDKLSRFIPDERDISLLKTSRTMDDLIETFLISEEAKKAGLSATTQEVQDRILLNFGGTDGFNKDNYYNYVLYSLKTTLTAFEDFLRREILREKMINLIASNVFVSDQEVKYTFEQLNTKANLEYIEINPSAFESVIAPSAEELKKTIEGKAKEIEEYYSSHRGEFEIEPQVRFSGIFLKAPAVEQAAQETDEAKKQELAKARKDAEDRIAAIRSGLSKLSADALAVAFRQEAEKFSEHEDSKKTGGEFSGFKKRADLMQPSLGREVAEALFMLKPGEMSGVVSVSGGFWLLLLHESTPAEILPLEKAVEKIANKFTAEESAKEKASSFAEKARESLKNSPDKGVKDVAGELNKEFNPNEPYKTGESGEFSMMSGSFVELAAAEFDNIPGIGKIEGLAKELRSAARSGFFFDKLFVPEDSRNIYVIRIKEFKPAPQPSTEELALLKHEMLEAKKILAYRAWFKSLKNRALQSGELAIGGAFMQAVAEEAKQREEALKKSQEGFPLIPSP